MSLRLFPVCLLDLYLRKNSGRPHVGNLTVEEEQLSPKENEGHLLVCKLCRNIITSQTQRKSVNSQHVHTFFNPHGVVFEFGCFSNAWGCVNRGTPTSDFTWFEGLSWYIASCSVCGEHLGWGIGATACAVN